MDMMVIIQFAVATLLPVLACVVLSEVRSRTSVARIPAMGWQVIVGIVFGCIAIFGTERGIPLDGAMMNVRDAAPLAAGLFFGGPAGIIAGIIGGAERWLSVMWGVGEFTRVGCSLGTVFAGFYAAALRRYLFDGRIPSWPLALATGVVAEVVHLLLIFLTNLDQAEKAFRIVQSCALPMISCVAISVMLCSLILAYLNKQPLLVPREDRGVAQVMQSKLLVTVVAAFIATVGFTAVLLTNVSRAETDSLLRLNIQDVEQDIVDASDAHLLYLTRYIALDLFTVDDATDDYCRMMAEGVLVAEVNVVNDDGIIIASNDPSLVGFDMASGDQSSEFLALLPGGGKVQMVQSYQPMSYDSTAWRKYAGVSVLGGFVQVGYDTKNFQDDLSDQVSKAVLNRHVGRTGMIIVFDDAGSIAGGPAGSTRADAEKLYSDTEGATPGRVFSTVYGDEECYARYSEVEGYRIVALQPVDESDFTLNLTVLIISFMEVLVFAVLFLVIYFVIKRVVVRSIWQVNGQLGEITRGDLDVEVDVRETTEFASLSNDINLTVGALKSSMAAVQADLDMAADIQMNTLPSLEEDIGVHEAFELDASMDPAKEVGGDFYDFFMVDDDHLALVVADVSGKGVPAALFMMLSKTVIKMEALSGRSPAEVLVRANADLSEKNEDDMFCTAWLGVLEISTGTLTYADAGHEKLALYHDGAWELPPKPNGAVALGSFGQEDYDDLPDKYQFRNHTVVLQPGDAIFQYSDGVTEATDANEDLFEEERLLRALNSADSASPDEILPHVRRHIDDFVQDAPQFDDITMLCLRYLR